MSKKILSIVFCVLMLMGMTACGGGSAEPQESEPVVSEAPETTPTPAPSADVEKNDAEPEKTDAPATAEPTGTPAPTSSPKPTATPKPTPTPTATPAPTAQTQTATKEAAQAYIGSSASAMAAAIGQPGGKNYSTSCEGDGEDGEWYYSGFTVFTYRDASGEQVVGVR